MKRRKKEHKVRVRFDVNTLAKMNKGSREELLGSSHEALRNSQHDLRTVYDRPLTREEKTYLLHADRGDYASVKKIIEEYTPQPELFDINCVDPLNRSALIAAIENENIELIKLLLTSGIKVKDALLHAIKEEYVEAVEMLLQWEEEHHVPGEPYSWESVEPSNATFTPDITPLILAAHRNHYEILKILLDRGATLPIPHDVKCGCDECVKTSQEDSLRHSQARINAYRALSSPSLIALSSADPLLTAFQLSWELNRLSRMETEFRVEYKALRQQTQEFATSLLDHTRTSNELEIMLNYNPLDIDSWELGERQTLGRLKLAIKYKQKMFVAHPNVQQLLGAIWYDGLPGFKRKNIVGQCAQVAKLGAMFPVYCTIYMLAPNSEYGQFMKKPFVKFICHSSSYMLFLMLLSLASQRAEFLVLEWSGIRWLQELVEYWKEHERGALPGLIEFTVIIYIASLIWAELRSLWTGGIMEYISDLWNIVDFITNMFYIAWISLRVSSWYIVQRDYRNGLDPWYPRERWDSFDPMLLSEGAFAAGMIFSYLKLVHIFSINPHLGPLQVSLGRMILDIIKFFFVYMLVLFAFGCGLNQLMWYYAELEKNKCYHLPNGLPDFDNQERACTIWRRYANLFETSQSLFWASFGLVDLTTFELTGIKSFTRFWALLTFGSYSVINIIVLLNMLIAMMSNSYQIISERSDVEWKFARTTLWMSYFEDGDTVPPPFNIIPTPKHLSSWINHLCDNKNMGSIINKSREKARLQHEAIMRVLVRRYVTAEQRDRDDLGVTEDDVMEIRQDISTLRYELIDILHNNGMKTPRISMQDATVAGKKGKVMERRILKDFQIGIVEGIINDVISSKESKPKDVFTQIAKAIGRKGSTDSKNRDWNALVRTNTEKRDPIGTTTEALTRRSRQSLRAHILDNVQARTMDPDKLLEYNPKLSGVTLTTRVAYAKFMRSKMQSDFTARKDGQDSVGDVSLEDEVFESPKKEVPGRRSARSFRSSPIPEMSDDEGLKDNEWKVKADIEAKATGSEGGSEQAQPLQSTSREPSEPSTPAIGEKQSTPSAQPDASKDHIIQIDDPESPSKALFITREEDSNLQKPISPTPSEHSRQSEQILSASALEAQYQEMAGSQASSSAEQDKPEPQDALLHAIKEEYVEAVEMLLQWEEEHHVPGEPYSWESVEPSNATFTPDITPLILAAHRNHYEILKILLDRGATLPIPHDVKCGCDECVKTSQEDSLRHSQARINAYRALSSPSLIALSSADPLLTAFQLSWELNRLSRMETEFRVEYKALRQQTQEFATSLLDHTRTSNELEIMLNYNPLDIDSWELGERQTLGRLKLAIKYKQKMFVAHPNVQQLLGAIWYDGLPGFKRKNIVGQCAQVAKLGAMFPVYCTIYMLAPNSEYGQFMKKPFVKFICHSSSYMLFLMLLSLASQRAEFLVLEWSGIRWLQELVEYWKEHERGALPGLIEFTVIIYIASLIWAELRSLWTGGIMEYISDLWNIVDFITNMFYIAWISLRVSSWYIVQRDYRNGLDPWYPRERWDSFDPMLLSEGAFAAGMIFSYLKLVHIFSINPHLGPLQVSLGRMILDIIKFFFVYMLVLFAFGCGLNQLMWYYAELEKNKCYHLPNGLPDFDNQERACTIWRRYANLFETSQSLFWASFGLVDLTTFELTGIKSFTRFWALLTFGSYSVINIIVLLNMLIAMMSNSYQIISERSDVEWKFARTTLWMSYFEDGDTVPPPFNIIPTPKHLSSWINHLCDNKNMGSIINKSREKARLQHEAIMRVLVRRYVTAEQRDRDDLGVTEDDVMEIRQDISTLRYELIDILHNNGMKTPRISMQDATVAGKKGKVMERRILKDFQIGIVEGIINDVISSKESKPKDVFTQIAKAIGRKGSTDSKNRDWNALVRTNTEKRDPIGTTTEALTRRSRQSLRAHILDNVQARTMDPDKLLEYNPKLSGVTLTTRVAYAKFMRSKMQSDFTARKDGQDSVGDVSLEDEVFESPKKEVPGRRSARSFRSSPIPEMSDDEGLKDNEWKVKADIEAKATGSEGGSEQAQPLQSTSREPSEPSTPAIGEKQSTPSAQPDASKDHIIQIDDPESPSKALFITREEDSNLQKPISPTPSEHSRQSEQILSASALEAQYQEMAGSQASSSAEQDKPEPQVSVVSETPARTESKEKSKSSRTSPKSSKVSPEAPQIKTDKGKSKVTGKVVSGWL